MVSEVHPVSVYFLLLPDFVEEVVNNLIRTFFIFGCRALFLVVAASTDQPNKIIYETVFSAQEEQPIFQKKMLAFLRASSVPPFPEINLKHCARPARTESFSEAQVS